MKGSKAIIDALNEVLAGELVAINQYFLHAKMCQNWGYEKIAQKIRSESIDEMRHAEWLINRILFLEGLPNLQRLDKLNIGQNVPEIFTSDVNLEYGAVKLLNRSVALAVSEADNTTRELFAKILASEEEHIDWLETQLQLIGALGEKQYLAEQLG
jgi:bacterioferritin